MRIYLCCVFLLPNLAIPACATAADPDPTLRNQAAQALRRGVEFFRKEVATQGGYLWQYSEDLSQRQGEVKAPATRVWVQPPGTPAVGMALLAAYEATSDRYYLEAATETAHALVLGQLRSGGWNYYIDFDAPGRKEYAYRLGGNRNARNYTVLDDDTTQSAIRFLLRVDQALAFKDAAIHESTVYALDSLLNAQFPNGAWPQLYFQPPDPAKYPVKKASYPQNWSRTHPRTSYAGFYTLNDNALSDVIRTLFDAERVYGRPPADTQAIVLSAKCRAAARRAGDFLLLAQMPEPQPAWAQQYNFDMHPAWARKFEPPAVSGGESQRVLRMLMLIYRHTGDRKYLEPVPRAIAYFRRSQLPNGQLARFYELQTNRPLYFTKKYEITYGDADLPTHYAFKVSHTMDSIAQAYARLSKLSPAELKRELDAETAAPPSDSPDALAAQAKKIIAAQDSRGRWLEPRQVRGADGKDERQKFIRCITFNRNVETLSRYLAATRAAAPAK